MPKPLSKKKKSIPISKANFDLLLSNANDTIVEFINTTCIIKILKVILFVPPLLTTTYALSHPLWKKDNEEHLSYFCHLRNYILSLISTLGLSLLLKPQVISDLQVCSKIIYEFGKINWESLLERDLNPPSSTINDLWEKCITPQALAILEPELIKRKNSLANRSSKFNTKSVSEDEILEKIYSPKTNLINLLNNSYQTLTNYFIKIYKKTNPSNTEKSLAELFTLSHALEEAAPFLKPQGLTSLTNALEEVKPFFEFSDKPHISCASCPPTNIQTLDHTLLKKSVKTP